jgi:hypothetical protein
MSPWRRRPAESSRAHDLTLEKEAERKLAVVSLIDQQVERIEWRAIVIGEIAKRLQHEP